MRPARPLYPVRCPHCQAQVTRYVKVPGLTWHRCKVCGKDAVVRATRTLDRVHLVVSPAS